MKKSIFMISPVFVFLVLMFYTVYPVLAQGDLDPETEEDGNFEVSFTESGFIFNPNLILPNKGNEWNIWKIVRLIEKGSINYEKTISIKNSGDEDITFDTDKIVVNIEGEESEEQLGASFFSFDGLGDGEEEKTLKPNEELKIKVTLDTQKLKEEYITSDKYTGYFKFWVNEMNDYLEVPVEISLKSPIWIPILVLLIAALAVPLGKALISSLEFLETKVKYGDLVRIVQIKGKNTIGVKWFKKYLLGLHEEYKNDSDEGKFENQMEFVKKMLALLDFEKENKVYKKLKALEDPEKEAEKIKKIITEYKKLETAKESDLDAKIQEVKLGILNAIGKITTIGVKNLSEEDKNKLETRRKPIRDLMQWISLRWAKAFLNIFYFISWIFVTGILIFWGLSEQYSNSVLWGVNPIKDWGAIFTWVFASSLTTTSVKDLIQEKILSKGGGEG